MRRRQALKILAKWCDGANYRRATLNSAWVRLHGQPRYVPQLPTQEQIDIQLRRAVAPFVLRGGPRDGGTIRFDSTARKFNWSDDVADIPIGWGSYAIRTDGREWWAEWQGPRP